MAPGYVLQNGSVGVWEDPVLMTAQGLVVPPQDKALRRAHRPLKEDFGSAFGCKVIRTEQVNNDVRLANGCTTAENTCEHKQHEYAISSSSQER